MWPTPIDSIVRRKEAAITRRRGMAEKLSVRTIEPSGQIVLECSECGEHLTLLGLEEDWPKEHRDAFGCSACGNTVTLAHRVDGTAYTIKALLKNSIKPFGPGV
jgi:hypothetical protein